MDVTETSEGKVLLDATLFPRLWDFVQRTLLDPGGVHLYLNPPQPVVPTPASSRKGSGRGTPVRKDDETTSRPKADEDEEDEQDRNARLRVGAFGAAEWVLSGCPTLLGEHVHIFNDYPILRTSRCQVQHVRKGEREGESSRCGSYNRRVPIAVHQYRAVDFPLSRKGPAVRRC